MKLDKKDKEGKRSEEMAIEWNEIRKRREMDE